MITTRGLEMLINNCKVNCERIKEDDLITSFLSMGKNKRSIGDKKYEEKNKESKS